MQNRNKLKRSTTGFKQKLKISIILYLILLLLLIYTTAIYLSYMELNNMETGGVNVLLEAMGYLFHLETIQNITFNLLFIASKMQFQNLWYIQLFAVMIIILVITSTKSYNEYRGTEHGSATWASNYDEKEFLDNKGIPIGTSFYATISNKKKKYYELHNLNEVVIGGSGAGKSFRKIKPDIMQMYGSYVVTDPKGELYRDTAKLLKENGYIIKVLNLIDINLSNTYNPFVYMKEEQDVLSVADLFMKNSAGEGEREDFWIGSAQDLLVAIMLYLWKSESEMKSFGRVIRLVNSISYKDGKIDEMCELARCLNKHKIENPNDASTINWNSMQGTPQETMGSIAKTLSTRLRLWAVEDVDELTLNDEMDFDNVGVEKTAIFLIIPPARQTYKAVANIFYSQLFERLMYVANFKFNGRLPLLVSCELDEFANIGKIPNFNETLSVVRSHNIRICVVLQGISQLKALYEKTYESIIGNCSIFTYLGTNDIDTKEYVVKRLGKTTVRTDTHSYNRGSHGGSSENESYNARDLLTVDELGIAMRPKGGSKKYGGNCIVFVDEFRPFFLLKFDTLTHPLIGKVGSSFPKDFHNNTDLKIDFGNIKSERKSKYLKIQKENQEKNSIDLEKAKKLQIQREKIEQNELANLFESQTTINIIEESIKQNELQKNNEFYDEISEEDFDNEFDDDVNPLLNVF